jgi:type VI secretion system secreted protein Hcp
MAFDTYMQFQDPQGNYLKGESQAQISNDSPLGTDIQQGNIFEIDDFSFDIEQVLNIGSASSGLGAGKVQLNGFQVTRKTDRASPMLFTMCCAGQHFKQVSLYLRRASGGASGMTSTQLPSGLTFLRFDFALVGVKTMSWSGSDGDEACKEEVTFEYGALKVQYVQQGADGQPLASGQTMGSWNQIYNNNQYDSITAS